MRALGALPGLVIILYLRVSFVRVSMVSQCSMLASQCSETAYSFPLSSFSFYRISTVILICFYNERVIPGKLKMREARSCVEKDGLADSLIEPKEVLCK